MMGQDGVHLRQESDQLGGLWEDVYIVVRHRLRDGRGGLFGCWSIRWTHIEGWRRHPVSPWRHAGAFTCSTRLTQVGSKLLV